MDMAGGTSVDGGGTRADGGNYELLREWSDLGADFRDFFHEQVAGHHPALYGHSVPAPDPDSSDDLRRLDQHAPDQSIHCELHDGSMAFLCVHKLHI